ncbi:MAG: hypothetical protein K2N48_07390, partial [Muribaculaceae bacterium]|nr:hypothetical protein [Muribaculaceae bacterium]
YYKFTDKNNINSSSENYVTRLSWLKRYCNSGSMNSFSPFYEVDESEYSYQNWSLPSASVVELWRAKLRVSKMRMYLVSDVKAMNNYKEFPICCYLPYRCDDIGTIATSSFGYFSSENYKVPDALYLIFYNDKEGLTHKISSGNNYLGLFRLVRPLTDTELENYKNNYLGYGSEPHRLTICHPDTYESTQYGWIEN